MKITKLANGNLILPVRTTKNNDVEYCVIQQIGVQMYVSGTQHLRVVQDGVDVGFINIADVSDTVLEPAPDVPFTGATSLDLLDILAADFLILSTDLAPIQADVATLQGEMVTAQADILALQTEYVTTTTNLSAAQLIALSVTPISSTVVAAAGEAIEGEVVVTYNAGAAGFTMGAATSIYLVGYTGVWAGNPTTAGTVMLVDITALTGTTDGVVQSKLNELREAITTTSWPIMLPIVAGTLKFTIVDESFVAAPLAAGNGTVRVVTKTKITTI
jgi:hypothetical protein